MQRAFLVIATTLVLWIGTAGDTWAGPGTDSTWPVTAFVTENSVLARYYRDYITRRPSRPTVIQMQQFCDLLMGSDLLANRLSQLGGSLTDMHAILTELGSHEFDSRTRLSKETRHRIRSLMLGLDMQLEMIEHSFSIGTRREFRREVLADIPPLNRVG